MQMPRMTGTELITALKSQAATANIPIVVEAYTNLEIVWTPLRSANLTNGSFYFSDPQWTNYPGRFYRLRSP